MKQLIITLLILCFSINLQAQNLFKFENNNQQIETTINENQFGNIEFSSGTPSDMPNDWVQIEDPTYYNGYWYPHNGKQPHWHEIHWNEKWDIVCYWDEINQRWVHIKYGAPINVSILELILFTISFIFGFIIFNKLIKKF